MNNEMKRLLFFTVTMGLFFSVNAQTDVQKITTNSIQKQPFERADPKLVPIKDVSILQKANVDKPRHKAGTYELYNGRPGLLSSQGLYHGFIFNMEFAAVNLKGNPGFWGLSETEVATGVVSTFTVLFPDSLVSDFFFDDGNPERNRKNLAFASTGFIFDPYSPDFDLDVKHGLFDSAGVYYAYRLDTLLTWIDYRIVDPQYSPNSPDTLRFYISYFDVYGKDNGSPYRYLLTYRGGGKSLSPWIMYDRTNPPKGAYATKPNAPNTVIMDYILSDKDSTITPPFYGRMIPVELPLKDYGNEFEVPAGSCLGVVVKFIPGNNDYGTPPRDTITSLTVNTTYTDDDKRYIRETRYLNSLSIRNWNYDTNRMAYTFDQTGYNSSLHETQKLRYQDTTDWGFFAYHGGYYGKPVFGMRLSVNWEDTVMRIDTTTGVTNIAENLVSKIYPNPATTQLTINLANQGSADIIVYDMLGQAVMQKTLDHVSNNINIAELSSGMYIVKVKQNGRIHTVKMSKK
jgi:hypothetical protein